MGYPWDPASQRLRGLAREAALPHLWRLSGNLPALARFAAIVAEECAKIVEGAEFVDTAPRLAATIRGTFCSGKPGASQENLSPDVPE